MSTPKWTFFQDCTLSTKAHLRTFRKPFRDYSIRKVFAENIYVTLLLAANKLFFSYKTFRELLIHPSTVYEHFRLIPALFFWQNTVRYVLQVYILHTVGGGSGTPSPSFHLSVILHFHHSESEGQWTVSTQYKQVWSSLLQRRNSLKGMQLSAHFFLPILSTFFHS
jgi:hypothetical protein